MKYIFSILAMFMLIGCVQTPPAGHAAVNNFSHIQPVNLNVASIDVQDQYIPPMKAPNIEHMMVNPPYHAAYNLAKRSFNAVGANDELKIIIHEAKIVQSSDNASAATFWSGGRTYLYKGFMRADVVLNQSVPPYSQLGKGEVKVNRVLKLPENTSLTQREIAMNKMVEEMMNDFHSGLIDVVQNKFNIVAP